MDQPEYGRHITIAGRTIHFSSLHLLFWVIGFAFLGQVLLAGGLSPMGGGFLDFGGIESDSIWAAGSSGPRTFAHPEHWWRGFTAMFLHVSAMHLLMNLWALYSLGRMADQIYGPTRLLLAFLLTGLGGNFAIFAWENTMNPGMPYGGGVGASGAVCGILGLLLAHMRTRTDVIGQMYGTQLLKWSLIILVFGLIVPAVSNTAHVGGFIVGYLLARIMKTAHFDALNRGKEQRVVAWAAGVLSVVTLVSFLLSGIGAVERREDYRDLTLIWGELNSASRGFDRGGTRRGSAALGIVKNTQPRAPRIRALRKDAIRALEIALAGDVSGHSKVNLLTHEAYSIASELAPDQHPPVPSARR